jgi:hypothetical protein
MSAGINVIHARERLRIAIERGELTLARGAWPSGATLTPADRVLIAVNLKAAREVLGRVGGGA